MCPLSKKSEGNMCLVLFLSIFTASATGTPDEQFIEDLKGSYKLNAPTLVLGDELPDLCFDNWVLCLSTSQHDESDIAAHLKTLHLNRKQDAVIFVKGEGMGRVIEKVTKIVPSLFRSPSPVFLPYDYAHLINPTLDSNSIFYKEEVGTSRQTLIDIYAVNGGPPIIQNIGSWSRSEGLVLTASKYRWNRRIDLRGSSISNALSFYKNNAEPVYDNQGWKISLTWKIVS